jgi:hypothetical protein
MELGHGRPADVGEGQEVTGVSTVQWAGPFTAPETDSWTFGPTSLARTSVVQRIDQAEERRSVWIVNQNAKDEAAGLADQLAGDGDQGIDEGLELQDSPNEQTSVVGPTRLTAGYSPPRDTETISASRTGSERNP